MILLAIYQVYINVCVQLPNWLNYSKAMKAFVFVKIDGFRLITELASKHTIGKVILNASIRFLNGRSERNRQDPETPLTLDTARTCTCL